MGERFRTVATFDLAYKADLAKAALEEAGIAVMVSNREVVSMDYFLAPAVGGVQLQVAEADVERALEVLRPFTQPGKGERPVSDEELERQAMAEGREDDAPPPVNAPAPPLAAPTDPNAPPPVDRDKYAWGAFWGGWCGLFCLPAWAYGFYCVLMALFASGPLSAKGRLHLRVAVVVNCIATFGQVILMATTTGMLRR